MCYPQAYMEAFHLGRNPPSFKHNSAGWNGGSSWDVAPFRPAKPMTQNPAPCFLMSCHGSHGRTIGCHIGVGTETNKKRQLASFQEWYIVQYYICTLYIYIYIHNVYIYIYTYTYIYIYDIYIYIYTYDTPIYTIAPGAWNASIPSPEGLAKQLADLHARSSFLHAWHQWHPPCTWKYPWNLGDSYWLPTTFRVRAVNLRECNIIHNY